MKNKHMLSLLQGGFTTITVTQKRPTQAEIEHEPVDFPWAQIDPFQRISDKYPKTTVPVKRSNRKYVYKARLEDNIVVGDVVVVMNHAGEPYCVHVLAVDETPKIDVDADFDYQWIVCKVDTIAYTECLVKEAEFNDALLEVEREQQRAELRTKFMENLPANSPARAIFDGAVKSLNQTIESEPRNLAKEAITDA